MTRINLALLAAAVALVGVSGVAHAQAGLNDLQVAHSAYTADTIDIEYAKIALQKSQNAEVRKFAELMISDHTAVNEGAARLLAKLDAKPEDNAFSQALIKGADTERAKLNSLSGVAFDREYAANELAYHQIVNKTIGETWIPNIKTPDLKVLLQQALVTFKVHEEHAGHMVAALKA